MFSIYEAFPEILELLGENLFTDVNAKKTQRSTERELTAPLFLFQCVEVVISIAGLDLLIIVLILDMWTEKGNDLEKYDYVANQNDFDRF